MIGSINSTWFALLLNLICNAVTRFNFTGKPPKSQVMTHTHSVTSKSSCQQWCACFTKCTLTFHPAHTHTHIRIRHVLQIECRLRSSSSSSSSCFFPVLTFPLIARLVSQKSGQVGVAGNFFSLTLLLCMACVDKLWNQVKWCVIKLTLQKLISIGLRWRQMGRYELDWFGDYR